ncbi:Hypothetical protein A7982_06904 [Minicystis rosea]|nr:Hypothetical protein A7982_06904 [Minicystis rosea]
MTSSGDAGAPWPSTLQWAGDEPAAIVRTPDAVMVKAVESGRSRLLRKGASVWVVHDPALDLVWVQGNDTLDVIDLRDGKNEVVAIATGLPTAVPIGILRTTDGGSHASTSPSGCDSGRTLTLDWESTPRLRYLDDASAGWVEPRGAALVGSSWLRAELGRAQVKDRVVRRDFPTEGARPAGPLASLGAKCAAASCGRPMSFDGSGLQIVVTSFEQGDCQHWGCHLYDPARKQLATPPLPISWGALGKVPGGSCGVYHFDRTGKRFLIEGRLCTVGGTCTELGSEGLGFLAGGADVGTSG